MTFIYILLFADNQQNTHSYNIIILIVDCFYIISQADKKRNRAKLIEFFADVAMECKKLNNFNSFMAISGELTSVHVIPTLSVYGHANPPLSPSL